MTRFSMYRLRPRGAFHFGAHGVGIEESDERCPSDTLYAALLATAQLSGTSFFAPPPAHDEARPLDPPLLLSSCFPFVGNTPLLPAPRLRLPLKDYDMQQRRKLSKKLAYVSPTIFNRIIADDRALAQYLNDANFHMGDQVWIAPEDISGEIPRSSFWSVDGVPHVTVDRIQQASNYFEVGQVRFAEGCGLYVLCRERWTGAAAELGELLAELGERGLGGRRSSGLGQFTVEAAPPLDLGTAPNPQRMVLLSRYRPSPAELQAGVLGEQASYHLDRVGGWLQGPAGTADQRRRAVRLLTEGSVVQMLPDGQAPLGTVCNVAPVYGAGVPAFPHPVWRYGLALGVGIAGASA